jgi:hypothetical protein
MRQQTLVASALTGLFLVSGSAPAEVEVLGGSATCAVTAPNHNTPPEAVRSKAGVPPGNPLIYGNDAIWTSLWPDGTVVFKKGGPGFVLADGSLKMKFLWLLATDGPLTVSGRRLDGEARPLTTEMPNSFLGRGFQPSYLIFPTVGCWEVTAKANGSTLTFVTTVATQGL